MDERDRAASTAWEGKRHWAKTERATGRCELDERDRAASTAWASKRHWAKTERATGRCELDETDRAASTSVEQKIATTQRHWANETVDVLSA